MANNHIKIYSTLLVIREMKIKITMIYHYTLTRKALIKKINITKCWEGCVWRNWNPHALLVDT